METSQEKIIRTLPPAGFKDLCTVRILKAHSKTSSSKRDMLQLDCEVVDPKNVLGVDKRWYELAGNKFTYFIMLDEEGKYGYEYATTELLPKLGIDSEEPLKTDNQEWLKSFEGVCFEAILSTSDNIQQKKDPMTGQYVDIKGRDGKAVTTGAKLQGFINEITRGVEPIPRGQNDQF